MPTVSVTAEDILYHGSDRAFSVFNDSRVTKGNEACLGELGFFFTPDAELAGDFCKEEWYSKESKYKNGACIYPVRVTLQSPYMIAPLRLIQISNSGDNAIGEFREKLIVNGYDGVIIEKDDESPDFIKELGEFRMEQVVAFYPEQIRSIWKG